MYELKLGVVWWELWVCHDVGCLPSYPEDLKVRSSCQGLFNKHKRLWYACMDHLSQQGSWSPTGNFEGSIHHAVSVSSFPSLCFSQFCEHINLEAGIAQWVGAVPQPLVQPWKNFCFTRKFYSPKLGLILFQKLFHSETLQKHSI